MPDENKVRKAAASVRTYVSEKGKIIPDLLTMDTNGVLCRKSQDKDDRNDFMYIFYISFLPVFFTVTISPGAAHFLPPAVFWRPPGQRNDALWY